MQTQCETHVMTCLAEECSYNGNQECCAPVVEIGDDHPKCDMYTTADVSIAMGMPRVQDCKVGECTFNSSMACSASGITLMTHSGHADCVTFRL